MKNFELGISWTMTTTVEVAAQNEKDAIHYALVEMRRPNDGHYLGSSMTVDSVEEMRTPTNLLRVK